MTAPVPDPDAATELTVRRLGPVRRYFVRHPTSMDLLVMALFVLGGISPAGTFASLGVGLGLVVYAVAASRPPHVAWLTLAAALLIPAWPVGVWERATDSMSRFESAVGTGVETALAVLVGLSIGTAVRSRRLHVAELIARSERLRRERDQQAVIARAAERGRIAREMHDVVTHSLSVMVALADGAGAALDRAPEASRAALGELAATGRSALADMRRVLGVLDDDGAPLEPQPGRLDLDVLVERFRAAGVPVVTDGLGTVLPWEAEAR